MPKKEAKTGKDAAKKLKAMTVPAMTHALAAGGYKKSETTLSPNGKARFLMNFVGNGCNTTTNICALYLYGVRFDPRIEKHPKYIGGVELRSAPYFTDLKGAWFFQISPRAGLWKTDGDVDMIYKVPSLWKNNRFIKSLSEQFNGWAYVYTPHGPNGKPAFYHMGKVYPITAKPDVKQASAN